MVNPMQKRMMLVVCAVCLSLPRAGVAQQRPLVTEDPETIGDNRILIEGGVELGADRDTLRQAVLDTLFPRGPTGSAAATGFSQTVSFGRPEGVSRMMLGAAAALAFPLGLLVGWLIWG